MTTLDSEFNAEAVYDKTISKLAEQLMEVCKKNEIPCVLLFMYAHKGDNGSFGLMTSTRRGKLPEPFLEIVDAFSKAPDVESRRRAKALSKRPQKDALPEIGDRLGNRTVVAVGRETNGTKFVRYRTQSNRQRTITLEEWREFESTLHGKR